MRTPISIAAAVILAALVLLVGVSVARESLGSPSDEAADALPVYLAAVTLADGGDPSSREDLQASYEARALRARAATFSTLYPATLPALLRPATALEWAPFVRLWRGALLLALLGCGALGMLVHPLATWARPVAVPLGLLLVLLIPASGECVRLGQANMALALLMALAMACAARRWDVVAGGALALGVAVKLVPGLLLLPLLVARRWRAAAAAVLVGLLCLALAAASLPLEKIVLGVVQTARFQAAIHPDWAARHAHPADWLAFLSSLRHGPLLLMSVAVGLPAVALRPERRVVVAVMALFSAWLGCSAAAFHMLYLPLLYPALLHLLAWPFERDSEPAWAVPVLGLALMMTAAAFGIEPPGVVLEARMSLLGLGLWLLCGLRLFRAVAGPRAQAHPWVEGAVGWYPAAMALLVGVLLAGALPQHHALAPATPPALQEEIQVGFIRPGDPAPGPSQPTSAEGPLSVDHRRTGRWPAVAVGSTLLPGSHGAVARHLALSRATWSSLEDDPTLGAWARWVLEASSSEVLHEQLAADALRALVREGAALEACGADPRLEALSASHAAVLRGEGASQRGHRSLGR